MIRSVSILIVCFNEQKNILPLLKALENQENKSLIDEILIADNGSNDQTFEIIRSEAQSIPLNLRFWQRTTNNIGAARRELIESARSDWVAFIDADCLPPPDWLEQLVAKAHQHWDVTGFAGVGGHNRLPGKNRFQVTVNHLLEYSVLHGFSSQAYSPRDSSGVQVDHLPTTNALLSKQAVVESGNFSEYFSRVGEDLDLGLRMTNRGYRLFKHRDPVIDNDTASNLSEWLLRMLRFGKAQGLTIGRRKGFIGWSLMLSPVYLSLALLLPFDKIALLTAIFTVCLVVVSLAHIKKPRLSLLAKGFVVCALTPAFYFLGFLNGLVEHKGFS